MHFSNIHLPFLRIFLCQTCYLIGIPSPEQQLIIFVSHWYYFNFPYMERTCIFFYVSVLLAHHFSACLTISLTNLKNEYALLAFKSHISFEPENPLSHNWSTTTYFCNWMGVTCSAYYQRVIALNLPNIDLTGTIPPYILSFLVSINFSGNNFSGPLPDEPSHLHRLKSSLICSTAILVDFFQHGLEHYLGWHILLEDNGFTGRIPPSLSNISNLETLSLSTNDIYQRKFVIFSTWR